MAVSDREFGELLGDVKSIKKDLAELENTTSSLEMKVDGILTQIAQVQGGLRVSIYFAGIIGALAMFGLTKVAPLLIGTLPKL